MRFIPICFFFCLLAIPAGAANWLWIESPHFDVLTNAGEKPSRALLTELEQFRATFLGFVGLQPEIPQRTTVVLFATDADFKPYKPFYQGKAKRAAGYFSGNAVGGFMALALDGDLTAAKGVIYHEYVHSLYHEIDWEPPLWFNEGSAEVFTTFNVEKGVAYLGRSIPWHVSLLRQEKLMSLPRLFSIGHGSPEYNEGRQQGIFYAESWALAHFLICNKDPAWRQKLNTLLTHMGSEPVDVPVFESVMGVTAARTQALLGDYVYGGNYSIFREKVAGEEIAAKITSRPALAVERDCVLNVLRVVAQDSPDAAFRLIKLEEQYPAAALPHESRAMFALRHDDPQRTTEELWQAVELNSTNVRTHWFLARQLIQTWLNAGISPQKRIGAATTGQLRRLLHRVVVTCPDAVDAWEALARTEAFAPDPDAAVLEQLEEQARRWPDDQRATQILMLAGFGHKRLGNAAAAGRIAQRVAASTVAAKSTQQFNRELLGEYLRAPDATP